MQQTLATLYPHPPRHLAQARRALPPLAALLAALLVFILLLLVASGAHAQTRLKDILEIEGVRDNMLVGYGLVVGLNGTGDNMSSSPFTQKSLVGMLERLGVNTRGDALKTKNVAAVMVTATLPPFSSQGSRLDVTISTLGDAKSLMGGTLLVTPLLGADGEVYAVGQGQVAVGGFSAGGEAETVSKGVPTSGRIANGAIVERVIDFKLADLPQLRFALKNPDFTTAQRVATAINKYLKTNAATAVDNATVAVAAPADRRANMVGLLTELEQLPIVPDQVARVVVDEQSGVIVMGENVRISTVAIAQGSLTIRITETPQVSQPNALSQGGTTQVVPRTSVETAEESGTEQMAIISSGVSLQELVQSLNALGIGPRDMITILQSIKAAGALQADLEII